VKRLLGVDLTYPRVLFALFVSAILLRLPAVSQGLPPYVFCDEDIFFGDAFRMLQSGSWSAQEFRSGNFNIYPALILAKVVSLFMVVDATVFLIIGRLFYAVFLGAASIYLVAAAARKLSGRNEVGLLAACGFLLSPTVRADSREWYPDHYLMFFSALILYIIVRILMGHTTRWNYISLGVAWGVGLSVKYTFAFMILPILIMFLATWLRLRSQGNGEGRFLAECLRATLTGVATGIVFALLNISAFGNPDKFVTDFSFNLTNYNVASDASAVDGILFYSFCLFALTIGVLGLIGMAAGSVSLARRNWWHLAVLLGFPAVTVLYLGTQGLVINRNIVIAIPFVLVLFACGLSELYHRSGQWNGVARTFGWASIAISAALPVAQVAGSFAQDLRPDSRVLAYDWIAENIPGGSTVGDNETCSGLSPAAQNCNILVHDPSLQSGLDYYVINSYWNSTFNDAYRGQSAVQYAWDQKYLHYYYFNDRELPRYFLTYFNDRIAPADLVPDGYQLSRMFSSNGPNILIVKRVGEGDGRSR
jgi:4-amino-4-deoxy-L-arabinose transferase-like glycosyltransferase